MSDREQASVIESFTDALDELGIEYAIGGSIASSLYGTVRFTQDADIAVAEFPDLADRLCDRLIDEFYISREAVLQALDSCGTFNAIHLQTSFKIDVFILASGEFEKQLLARRRRMRLSDSEEKSFCVVSPEDIILLKLAWYARGGCASDRHWQDILGVLRVQGESIEMQYMNTWSRKLGVEELLQRVVSESKG